MSCDNWYYMPLYLTKTSHYNVKFVKLCVCPRYPRNVQHNKSHALKRFQKLIPFINGTKLSEINSIYTLNFGLLNSEFSD